MEFVTTAHSNSQGMLMSVPLSRPYPSRYGAPVLDRVDPGIFQYRYYHHCMKCDFCHDSCCQYGADIETIRIRELEKYQSELETYLDLPREKWFRDDPEDIGILPEPEYPGGEYTRTAVGPLPAGRSKHTEEACVFLDPVGRGCRIHRFALERNIDVHEIKPMVCLFFPLCHSGGELRPAIEFGLGDLVCMDQGLTIYESSRDEVRYYFGDEMVAELDRIAKDYPPPAEDTSKVSLPIAR
jgi:Fe-S-cluster containining protein